LRREGHIVTKLMLTEPTLNEVYLEYTGRSLRDTEESQEAFRTQRMTMMRARGR
jgi:ABC-2 type transport system ATP-binding protein